MLEASERELVHTRHITCRGYRRADGLWEVEGSVRDEKGEEAPFRSRPPVKAGEDMHHMRLTLVVDNDYTIREVRAQTLVAPWPECGQTDPDYGRLVGLRIGRGFMAQVHERVGSVRGCTHITGLIAELANTYMQSSWPDRMARQRTVDPDPRRWPDRGAVGFVRQCHAWREGGEALRREFPELQRGTESGEAG